MKARKGFEFIGAIGGQQGLDAMRRVKPVFVVTADNQPVTKALGLHVAKVDDFIVKPFDAQELVQRIEKVLRSD